MYSRDTDVHSFAEDPPSSRLWYGVMKVVLTIVNSYLPAANTEKEAEDIGLLLLLKLFDIFEGTHLSSREMRCQL